ncbi:NAD-dependent epimerase/dehydratase family protein [Devosia sp. A8/3-2]|nr:NAD-dependent epimerase/dehydratase family protein [Devosia sp. A8/3-2]
MKIVITGASGHIGRQLVPPLQRRGIDLLLVGRDTAKLGKMFPGALISGYNELANAGRGADLLVHLAVLNNDNTAALDQFEQVNVDLAFRVLGLTRDAGIRRFLNISTIHAPDDANQSNYAVSKRNANARLRAERSGTPEVLTVFLPAVVGQRLSGKLAVLDRVPERLRGALLMVLSSLRPVVGIEHLANFLVEAARHAPMPSETILSDGQQSNPVFLFLKRFIDLGFAFAVIVLLWWLLILIWIGIKLQSPGPGIFSQCA